MSRDLRQLPIPGCGGALADPDSVGWPYGDWSPDGRQVVFAGVTAAGVAVYAADLQTLDVRRISPSGVIDYFPEWGVRPRPRHCAKH
jgi:hypothetical protein